MLNLSLSLLLLSPALPPSADAPAGLLGEPFENRRLHIRIRPPAGWQMVSAGSSDNEPIEFWESDEGGPRLQITSYPYPIPDGSQIEKVQAELRQALLQKFPDLRVDRESSLMHRGDPAIEVMATLAVEDTYYHVLQRCLFAHGRIFIITCASFESSFLSELPSFRASLDSVEVLEEIFGSHASNGPSSLITSRTLGLSGFGFLLAGIFLRRLSIARLNRSGR
jgi:hypothetical protein